MRHARWPNAAIAALLLAACAQKPVPQRPPDEETRRFALRFVSSMMFCTVRGELLGEPDPLSMIQSDCSTHLSKALDILAARCPTLPPPKEPVDEPGSAKPVARRVAQPAPDPLLVHLCTALPWQGPARP